MKTYHTLQKLIIEELSFGPQLKKELITHLSESKKVTIQAVYKALRILKKEEIVLTQKKIILLSSVWIMQKIEEFERIQKIYSLTNHFFGTQHGSKKRISFSFATLAELDLFWTHAILLLEDHCTDDAESISIIPHDWFMYSREQTDSIWTRKHVQKTRRTKIVITHATPLDKKVSSLRKQKLKNLLQILFANPLRINEQTYYNYLGPYCFKITLDTDVAYHLQNFIKNNTVIPIQKEKRSAIQNIMSLQGDFHMAITKSQVKSDSIKKKLEKYFL